MRASDWREGGLATDCNDKEEQRWENDNLYKSQRVFPFVLVVRGLQNDLIRVLQTSDPILLIPLPMAQRLIDHLLKKYQHVGTVVSTKCTMHRQGQIMVHLLDELQLRQSQVRHGGEHQTAEH